MRAALDDLPDKTAERLVAEIKAWAGQQADEVPCDGCPWAEWFA